MVFQYSGGTDRQRKWVQDAITTKCTYPFAQITDSITVTFTWGAFPGNLDSTHPYMTTTVVDAKTFTITIAPWADDPTNNGNQGLPNPAQDIQEFYMQSVVHELGHLVTYLTFDPASLDTDARILRMCGLFWRVSSDSGSGRRYGAMGDWDTASLAWEDEIREAVADVFKCAFYTGRLVFGNRTNWHIDERDWQTFLKLITWTGASVAQGDLASRSGTIDVSVSSPTNGPLFPSYFAYTLNSWENYNIANVPLLGTIAFGGKVFQYNNGFPSGPGPVITVPYGAGVQSFTVALMLTGDNPLSPQVIAGVWYDAGPTPRPIGFVNGGLLTDTPWSKYVPNEINPNAERAPDIGWPDLTVGMQGRATVQSSPTIQAQAANFSIAGYPLALVRPDVPFPFKATEVAVGSGLRGAVLIGH